MSPPTNRPEQDRSGRPVARPTESNSEQPKPIATNDEQKLRESTLLSLDQSPETDADRSPPKRISATQLTVIAERLGPSGLFALKILASYRLMQASQLARILFFDSHTDSSSRRARRLLKRLHGQDLVRRLDRRIGGVRAGSMGHVYAVSPLGHRLLGSPKRKRWAEPSGQFVRHTLAIAELGSLAIRAASEQAYGYHVEPEPEAWRSYDTGQRRQTVKPDLFAMIRRGEDELHWFIEIDLATESLGRIERKCLVYADYLKTGIEQRDNGLFPKVLWVAPDERRANQLIKVLSKRQWPDGLFALTMSERAVTSITNFDDP